MSPTTFASASLPASTLAALEAVFGAEVHEVQLIERSWRVRWHKRALATTRPNRIYLRGSVEEFAGDNDLVLHEYFHVLRQWLPGHLTRWRYVGEWLRRGYFANRFEVEARDFVSAHLRKFSVLVARAREERALSRVAAGAARNVNNS